jgi:hypothetical protein
MSVIVSILAIEKIAAPSLGIKVPKQNGEPVLSQHAGKIDRCGGFANAAFDIINGQFFQVLKLQNLRLNFRKLKIKKVGPEPAV